MKQTPANSIPLVRRCSRSLQTAILLAALQATTVLSPALLAQSDARKEAIALEQEGHNSEAEQRWKQIAASNPSNAEAFAHLGLLASRQERFAEAISNYDNALRLAPNMPGLRMNLGLAYFKAAQFPAAIKVFTDQLRQHPDGAHAVQLATLLGMAHYGMGDYLVAIPYLERAAANDPQSLPLRLTLAHSCLWSKQYDCVLTVYKQILALNADSAEADMLAGEALDEKGDDAGAIEQFRAATRANPTEPNAHFGLGYLFWKEQHFDEAAVEFQAELDLDPTKTQARAYLADSLVQTTHFDQARPELEHLATEANSSAMVHRDLGIVYAETARPADALKQLQQAILLDPSDVSAHWRLAKVYQATGNRALAKSEFEIVSTMKQQSAHPLTQQLDAPP
jgi:tetratricopeptide (TPR) repeat protein